MDFIIHKIPIKNAKLRILIPFAVFLMIFAVIKIPVLRGYYNAKSDIKKGQIKLLDHKSHDPVTVAVIEDLNKNHNIKVCLVSSSSHPLFETFFMKPYLSAYNETALNEINSIIEKKRKAVAVDMAQLMVASSALGANCVKRPRVYSIAPNLAVKSDTVGKGKIISRLPVGRWTDVLERKGSWIKIELLSGDTGYVRADSVSDIWIKVWKKEHRLFLMKNTAVEFEYIIALGFNPVDDKVKRGDGCTPHGRFFICEMLPDPKPRERYGARSMRLSYPGIEDARRGLRNKLITRAQYLKIVRAIHAGRMPPQNTILGGSIRIHGGGIGQDWTLGCIALDDSQLVRLYGNMPFKNGMVEVYADKVRDAEINRTGYTNAKILQGAKKLFNKQCTYTRKAISVIPLKYPMGDFDKSMGVCTDVVIRTLRHMNIDLQALMHEDITMHPHRYKKIKRANHNIDHRRTRNLKILFDHNALRLTNTPPAKASAEWRPGDIVLMDTGIENGTIYDHIGIVSDMSMGNMPLVINLWTVGYKLEHMPLLDGEYPEIVGHYRLTHPFDYHALP
jgi:uncharacterized protein YijF (DUF1287 family)